jgi:glycosyltransferase involved in cell wall biosynthesis
MRTDLRPNIGSERRDDRLRITFSVLSHRHRVGGVDTAFAFANGLARLGHDVHIRHMRWPTSEPVTSLEQIPWFHFDERIVHHLPVGDDPVPFPEADVLVGSGPLATTESGLPAAFIQGYNMVSPIMEARAYANRGLKLCVARWLVDVGLELGVPAHRLVHVPQGIDHERFRVVTPIGQRAPRVAMLYNPLVAKGASVGLNAIARARDAVPQLDAVVFGTFDLRHELPSGVRYVHDPTRDELATLYDSASIFLCSSHREGFGLCNVEAMASGCALVTTDNGGSRDYASDGHSAIVCSRADPEPLADALAEGIVGLVRDDARRGAIAENGVTVARSFEWDTAIDRFERALIAYVADPERYLGEELSDVRRVAL